MNALKYFIFVFIFLFNTNVFSQNVFLDINVSDDVTHSLDVTTIREECKKAVLSNGLTIITTLENRDIVFRADINVNKVLDGYYICAFNRVVIFVEKFAYVTQSPSLIAGWKYDNFQRDLITLLRNYIAELPDLYNNYK